MGLSDEILGILTVILKLLPVENYIILVVKLIASSIHSESKILKNVGITIKIIKYLLERSSIFPTIHDKYLQKF